MSCGSRKYLRDVLDCRSFRRTFCMQPLIRSEYQRNCAMGSTAMTAALGAAFPENARSNMEPFGCDAIFSYVVSVLQVRTLCQVGALGCLVRPQAPKAGRIRSSRPATESIGAEGRSMRDDVCSGTSLLYCLLFSQRQSAQEPKAAYKFRLVQLFSTL